MAPARRLPKQFQAAGGPAWDRPAPLLYCGNALVFVPGLGIDARCQAPAGAVQLGLAWVPDPAPAALRGTRSDVPGR